MSLPRNLMCCLLSRLQPLSNVLFLLLPTRAAPATLPAYALEAWRQWSKLCGQPPATGAFPRRPLCFQCPDDGGAGCTAELPTTAPPMAMCFLCPDGDRAGYAAKLPAGGSTQHRSHEPPPMNSPDGTSPRGSRSKSSPRRRRKIHGNGMLSVGDSMKKNSIRR